MYEFNLQDPHFLPHASCDIQLLLRESSCLVLTGENGIGKSTLARRIQSDLGQRVSLIEQASLETFFDRPVKIVKKIFQDRLSHLINLENFVEFWEAFNLTEKEDRVLSDLSGGESQALKLVLGMCGFRPYLILDEPSQFLDLTKQKVLMNCLEKLQLQKKSILLIEHDLQWISKKYPVVNLINVDGKIESRPA